MKIPLSVCEERDPKGLYKLARSGKLKGFTGEYSSAYAPLWQSCDAIRSRSKRREQALSLALGARFNDAEVVMFPMCWDSHASLAHCCF